MTTQEQDGAHQQQHSELDSHQAFWSLAAALPWLMQQYLADGIRLLQTEGRLALRSLVMIAVLIFTLAGIIAGSWLILVVLAVYTSMEAGVPSWGVALGVVLLHLLLFAALAKQIKALARYLFFPNSRYALDRLISRDPPPGL